MYQCWFGILIWLLQSVPIEVLEHYNMTSMTLEFRRECTQSNLLESMTCPTARVMESNNNSKNRKPELQYTHLLRLQQDKADVVRARTEWNFKQKHQWYTTLTKTTVSVDPVPFFFDVPVCFLLLWFCFLGSFKFYIHYNTFVNLSSLWILSVRRIVDC